MKTPILRPATEAVLFGFERIGMIIRIAWLPIVLSIGLFVGSYWLLVGGNGPEFSDFNLNDPEQIFEGLIASPGFVSYYLLQVTLLPLLASLILSCVYVAATRASTLADYEPPNMPFYFALGGREIRYFIVRILYFILLIVASALIGSVGLGVAAITIGALDAVDGDGAPLMISLAVAVGFCLFVAWLWVVVRFLPVLPIAAIENRISFGDAWKMTKGNFWRLVMSGAMFLAIMEGVLFVFLLALFLPAIIVLGLIAAIGASIAGPGALIVLTPLVIIAIVAVVVIAAFALAARSAYTGRIYAYLSGCGEACKI